MFSERLKRLREENEYNQEYVAEYLGVKQQTYSRYENNQTEPDIASLKKLTGLFQVSADYLLGLSRFRQGELDKLPEELKDEVNDFIGYLLEKRKKVNQPPK
jgi:transcriptional regulator with XRE-family HTH domain